MGVFDTIDETKTILPVKVSDVDIYTALKGIRFDITTLSREVAADYITGIMDLYRDAGGTEDILGKIMEEHFEQGDAERVRKQLKPNLPFQQPRMVPWALYEIVVEEVRKDLAKQKGFEEKTDPTVFPFLVGVYSIVAHPLVVFSSSVLSIEGLIENVNKFGEKLNTVTTMKTTERGVYDPDVRLMRATLQRQQDKTAVQALEELLRTQERSDTKDIIRAICTRDLATVCGALVGGSLLKGQRLRYMEIEGDPQNTTDIEIYYPKAYRSTKKITRAIDALGLVVTRGDSSDSVWRERYVAENLEAAIAPLNALASKVLSRRIEAITRAEEAGIRIKRLRELAREASHHVKNPASALLAILQKLAPDEEEMFRELREDETRETHVQIIKEIAGASLYKIEGLRGQEVPKRLTRRYEAYKSRAEQEGITPLARRIFDPLCGTYGRTRTNASVAILDDLLIKVKAGEYLDDEERNRLDTHYRRMRKGLEDAERIAGDIIERTKNLSALAREDFTREESHKEKFCLYDAIVEGTRLLEMQPDKPKIVIDVAQTAQVVSNRETIVSTIENITWNAYEAIQGKAGVDAAYKGEAVVLYYDEEKEKLYIANTGPAIPDHRIPEIFSVRTKTGIAKPGLKQATGTGTSMALKRDMLAALEQKLDCYSTEARAVLQERYAPLREYGAQVVFGIEFRS